MTLCLLQVKTRTERDKQFYRLALELQLKSHMANGASADEYSKRAHAFIKKINPNLPQLYVEGGISDYLVDLMPADLRESRETSQIRFGAERAMAGIRGSHLPLPGSRRRGA